MQCPSLLNHTVAKNQWIHDVAAGHATPCFHPHGMIAFSHINQVIGDHESITLSTTHGILLSRSEWPSAYPRTSEILGDLCHLFSKQAECQEYLNRLAGFIAES